MLEEVKETLKLVKIYKLVGPKGGLYKGQIVQKETVFSQDQGNSALTKRGKNTYSH